jgi:arginyl-tRNA synthetase
MQFAWDRFVDQARAALVEQAGVPSEQVELVVPKPNIPADLAFPTFRSGRPADQIVARLSFGPDSLIAGAAAAGPYVNFTARLTGAVLDEAQRYGRDDVMAGTTAVVEYSSPNVARRMHVGHVRSTIIGQALANILGALGCRVVADNHIGDWGKNFGVLLAAIEGDGRPDGEGEAALAELERLYARYSQLAEAEPSIDQAARGWSLRLERGDAEARELWRWIVDLTLRANQRLYDRLGVRFDTVHGESRYQQMMAPLVERAVVAGVARPADGGAVVVELEGLPTFLLQRSDGGSLYHTRDAATIAYRVAEYRPDAIVYVVDARQELHFRQLFALARALGVDGGAELVHVPFGIVVGPDGQPLAARRGNMVYLEALLDEARARARRLVDDDEIAEAVGVGALIWNDLYQDPRRNMQLDWDRMLSLEGNSAPYVQYMHARCRSILRRSDGDANGAPSLLTHPSEHGLVRQLARLPTALREAGRRYAPHLLCDWCHETARATALFYRDCPVLAAPTDLRRARLRLVAATATALEGGLARLGIRAPERM